MTQAAKEARARYAREYNAKNRERLNEYRRNWRRENPDKVRQYNEDYWKHKAEGGDVSESETNSTVESTT